MTENLLAYPKALVNQVKRIALTAGEITLEYFDECGFVDVETKEDGSPVTVADKEAEKLITAGLKEILPDVKVIGEESVSDGFLPDVDGDDCFWMVDPIDGTHNFIQGSPEYSVNIALIKNKRPFLGVIYAPATGELYSACLGEPAMRLNVYTEKEKEIRVRKPVKRGLVVTVSHMRDDSGLLDNFLKDYKVAKTMNLGSSLKMCAVACGKADIYPRFGPTGEWDTAAGHAILQSAGGDIVGLSGEEFIYGKASSKFINSGFIAASGGMIDML